MGRFAEAFTHAGYEDVADLRGTPARRMAQDLRNITFHMKTLGGRPPELRLVCDGVRELMEAKETSKQRSSNEEEEEQVRQALALSMVDAACSRMHVNAQSQCEN